MNRIPRRSVSQALVAALLTDQLMSWQQERGVDAVTVLDVGGGTGGLASHLADLGHTVTVIDPSADALASLERRAAESGVGSRLTGRQGDASDVVDLVGPAAADLVVCHRVLEVVDHPVDALAAMATCLRPGGLLSLLVPGRRAAVLGHALNGQFEAAGDALTDERRFDPDQIVTMLGQVGFEVTAQHGVGAIADLVPESAVESQTARDQLTALEQRTGTDPAFRALAPQLHVAARLAP
ncbi:MAG TPA: methyltransferase domain-containing protein [Bacillota bacterium]|nr:methyltransferase domain-containing protein [Bacillota bacterium]